MILRGILDNSLGQYCIRGFAYLKDLEISSRADFTFQRNLIESQDYRIQDFLENSTNLFFPEVILSFKIPNYSKRKEYTSTPFFDLLSNIDINIPTFGITLKTKEVKYRGIADSRNIDSIRIVTIQISDKKLQELINDEQEPFLRIDGNHRLSAAEAFKENTKISELVTPFCLILLNSIDDISKKDSEKFERTIFHNINSKSIPLTDEEIYRSILDFPEYFSDKELLTRSDFGGSYLAARLVMPNVKERLDNFPSLVNTLNDMEKKIDRYRTVLVHFFDVISNESDNDSNTDFKDSALLSLNKANIIYTENPLLINSKSPGLLVAFMFFIYSNNLFNLEWFTSWVLDNHIYELENPSHYDLIRIFNKMIQSQERTIFISMAFGKPHTERHYNNIVEWIKEINKDKGANIKLYPLRIDKFKDGSAYKIPDVILNKIENSGMLIADLTHQNPNVYHEIGYLMGLNKAKNKKRLDLLLICNTSKTVIPNDIGFNIRNHKILGFEDTSDLKQPLKDEIIKHYFSV